MLAFFVLSEDGIMFLEETLGGEEEAEDDDEDEDDIDFFDNPNGPFQRRRQFPDNLTWNRHGLRSFALFDTSRFCFPVSLSIKTQDKANEKRTFSFNVQIHRDSLRPHPMRRQLHLDTNSHSALSPHVL